MNSTVNLSEELQRLSAEFQPFESSGARLTGSEVQGLRGRLLLFTRLARSQEEELAVHRLIEANRAIGAEVEQIASAARERLAGYRDDNVVDFSDFRGGNER